MTLATGRRKRGEPRVFSTVRERIAWSYANVGRAHAALSNGRTRYVTVDHMVRARLFKGLCDGSMRVGTFFDDERLKLLESPHCVYCGDVGRLAIDHLVPRSAGGADDGANLVRSCKSCNSSKGDSDLLVWMRRHGISPRLLLYRRYLKVMIAMLEQADLLDVNLDDTRLADLPFDIRLLPWDFSALTECKL